MAKKQEPDAPEAGASRDQLLAVMRALDLPAPERMLGRLEGMLPARDRERVLSQLVADFQQQGRDDIKRILKVLAPDREEWVREVENLLRNYHPA